MAALRPPALPICIILNLFRKWPSPHRGRPWATKQRQCPQGRGTLGWKSFEKSPGLHLSPSGGGGSHLRPLSLESLLLDHSIFRWAEKRGGHCLLGWRILEKKGGDTTPRRFVLAPYALIYHQGSNPPEGSGSQSAELRIKTCCLLLGVSRNTTIQIQAPGNWILQGLRGCKWHLLPKNGPWEGNSRKKTKGIGCREAYFSKVYSPTL